VGTKETLKVFLLTIKNLSSNLQGFNYLKWICFNSHDRLKLALLFQERINMKTLFFSFVIAFVFLFSGTFNQIGLSQNIEDLETPIEEPEETVQESSHSSLSDPIEDFEYNPDETPIERVFVAPSEESLRLTEEQVQNFSCADVTVIPQIECEALVALYQSTNGSAWSRKTNWLETNDIETWSGVFVEDGHVNELDIQYNNLTGNLPSELGDLTKIRSIQLNRNQLIGTIPASFGNYYFLYTLALHENFLSGSIPPELGQIDGIDTLSLHSNELTGNIPPELGSVSIRKLDLHSNLLTGSIPPELANYRGIKKIILHSNKLSGTIPIELANRLQLFELDLHSNNLSGTIPVEFGSHLELRSLDLSFNCLSGSIPSEFGNLRELDTLNLSSNNLTGTIPRELTIHKRLNYLNLSSNHLSGFIPPEFGEFESINTLNFANNQLTGTIPGELANPRISYLNLSSNQLHGEIPTTFGPQSFGFHALIDFSDNALTGTIPPKILQHGYIIRLNKNQLTGTIEGTSFFSAWELDLSENQLSGKIPSSLLSGSIKVLDLHSNKFSGSIVVPNVYDEFLLHLDLSNNLLEGAMPEDFTKHINLCVEGDMTEPCNGVYKTDLGYNLFTVPQEEPVQSFLNEKDPDWYLTQGVKLDVSASEGGTLTSQDGRTTIEIPPNVLQNDTSFLYMPQLSPKHATIPYLSLDNSFDLTAEDVNGAVTQFNLPLVFTLRYLDEDFGQLEEDSAYLHYYDEVSEKWFDALSTCSSGSYTRNLDENWLSLPVCHLTEFALVASGWNIHFPAVLK
jgi:Leucine-rich repeat (LRR) protein